MWAGNDLDATTDPSVASPPKVVCLILRESALFVRCSSGVRPAGVSGMRRHALALRISEAWPAESRFGGTGKILTQYGKVVGWDGRTLWWSAHGTDREPDITA